MSNNYSVEFKLRCAKTAKAMKEGKIEAKEIALALGIAESLINKWIRAYDNGEIEHHDQSLDRGNNEISLIYDMIKECLEGIKKINERIDTLTLIPEPKIEKIIPSAVKEKIESGKKVLTVSGVEYSIKDIKEKHSLTANQWTYLRHQKKCSLKDIFLKGLALYPDKKKKKVPKGEAGMVDTDGLERITTLENAGHTNKCAMGMVWGEGDGDCTCKKVAS